jgi:hypothetical protein
MAQPHTIYNSQQLRGNGLFATLAKLSMCPWMGSPAIVKLRCAAGRFRYADPE